MNPHAQHTPEWHEAKTGNHQRLIIDGTGRNVAVVYDKLDAPLIAAAPELLAHMEASTADKAFDEWGPEDWEAWNTEAKRLIAKARGQ